MNIEKSFPIKNSFTGCNERVRIGKYYTMYTNIDLFKVFRYSFQRSYRYFSIALKVVNEFEFNGQIISLFHLSLIFFARGICLRSR